MKIINLRRGCGKTIRLLYASEYNQSPILCATNISKQYLVDMAEQLHLNIPEPIAASELTGDGVRKTSLLDQDILVDEAPMVLQSLLSSLGMRGEVKAITLTAD